MSVAQQYITHALTSTLEYKNVLKNIYGLHVADINVDDEWFLSEPRRTILIGLVGGDPYRADGMAMAAWRLARRYWGEGRKLIPLDLWELSGLAPLEDAKLAKRQPEGVYVCGTRAHCDYLLSRSEAAAVAGRASAEARKDKYGTSQPIVRTSPERPRTSPNVPNVTNVAEPFTLLCFEERETPNGVSPPTRPPGGSGGAPSDFDFKLSLEWLTWARGQVPSIKAKPVDWANAVRLMREQDGLTEAEVAAVLAFVRDDPFWGKNALSPVALRQRSKNGLKKLENVRLAMQRDGIAADGRSALDRWNAEQDAKDAGKGSA